MVGDFGVGTAVAAAVGDFLVVVGGPITIVYGSYSYNLSSLSFLLPLSLFFPFRPDSSLV